LGGLVALLVGCDADESPMVPEPPVATWEQLQAAPESLSLDSRSIQVDPVLYRDFMPISPPEGRPLVAGCRLWIPGVEPFPAIVIQEAFVWVFDGDAVWFKKANITRGDAFVDIRIAGGPLWGPGTYADMVIGIRDGDGVLQLVARPHVLIAAVY